MDDRPKFNPQPISEFLEDQDLIGLTFDQAAARLVGRGLTIRMTFRDGEACICTRDYRTDRVNVAVIKDIVVEVTGRG